MSTNKQLTPQDVIAFMTEHANKLLKAKAGYSLFQVTATNYPHRTGVEFRCYHEGLNWGLFHSTPEAAVNEMLEKMKPAAVKSAATELREQAALLIAEADAMEATG